MATLLLTHPACLDHDPGAWHPERPQRLEAVLAALSAPAFRALERRAAHGLRRVAVVDFDVHHGNGTQAMFERDPGLFFASTHQMPLYPGTGAAEETGVAGNVVNAPLRPHS
ncbi:MAG: histone deacetylase family protein, partial [Alphaproteobacteria bacterium]